MASNIPYYISDTEDDDEIALSYRKRTKRTRIRTLKGDSNRRYGLLTSQNIQAT